MTYLTWRKSGGTHHGERNGATLVKVEEINHGMYEFDLPALFTCYWAGPFPAGWWREQTGEQHEWRGTPDDRDALLEQAKAAGERTFARWASLMGLIPVEVITDPARNPFPSLRIEQVAG